MHAGTPRRLSRAASIAAALACVPACSTVLGIDALVADRAATDGGGVIADSGARADAGAAPPTSGCASTCGTAGCGACPAANVKVPTAVGTSSIGPYEVTVDDYRAWLDTRPSVSGQRAECSWNTSFEPGVASKGAAPPECAGWLPKQVADAKGRRPVVCIDWCDAAAYCRWANAHLCGRIGGGSLTYAGSPDTARGEWWNACSAGGSKKYPYGTDYVQGACNDGNSHVQDVGSFSACEGGVSGVFDMSGNVPEWEDQCTSFDNPPEDENCLVRGGAYFNDANGLTCMSYRELTRASVDIGVGFRCCG